MRTIILSGGGGKGVARVEFGADSAVLKINLSNIGVSGGASVIMEAGKSRYFCSLLEAKRGKKFALQGVYCEKSIHLAVFERGRAALYGTNSAKRFCDEKIRKMGNDWVEKDYSAPLLGGTASHFGITAPNSGGSTPQFSVKTDLKASNLPSQPQQKADTRQAKTSVNLSNADTIKEKTSAVGVKSSGEKFADLPPKYKDDLIASENYFDKEREQDSNLANIEDLILDGGAIDKLNLAKSDEGEDLDLFIGSESKNLDFGKKINNPDFDFIGDEEDLKKLIAQKPHYADLLSTWGFVFKNETVSALGLADGVDLDNVNLGNNDSFFVGSNSISDENLSGSKNADEKAFDGNNNLTSLPVTGSETATIGGKIDSRGEIESGSMDNKKDDLINKKTDVDMSNFDNLDLQKQGDSPDADLKVGKKDCTVKEQAIVSDFDKTLPSKQEYNFLTKYSGLNFVPPSVHSPSPTTHPAQPAPEQKAQNSRLNYAQSQVFDDSFLINPPRVQSCPFNQTDTFDNQFDKQQSPFSLNKNKLEKEQSPFDLKNGKKLHEISKKATSNGSNENKDESLHDGFDAPKIKNGHKFLRDGSFFEQNEKQILAVFNIEEARYKTLEEAIPNSKWVKIFIDSGGEKGGGMGGLFGGMGGGLFGGEGQKKYFIAGLIGTEFLCYGVPADFSPRPPKELDGNCWWLPADQTKPTGKGYWIMWQDLKSGEAIFPDKA
ncbi:MAG: hypothetical protein FWD86_00955 [Firmicutes bacterium]|nr:hypothetical protein [Bacillota bacterium]